MLKTKKIPVIFTLILFFAVAESMSARESFAGITGSKHDFSAQGWSGGEICIACHTPHNADTSQYTPLWSHQTTGASFTLYSSRSLDGVPEQPRSASRACLSCHDGTIALDSFGGNNGSVFIDASADMGTDLSNDHPVSIKYDHEPGTTNCLSCHDVHNASLGTEPYFVDGYVECTSCHDVHNNTSYPKLLRKSLQKSELCLLCHAK